MMADSSKFLKTLLPWSSLTMMDICFLIKNPRLHIYTSIFSFNIRENIPSFLRGKMGGKEEKIFISFYLPPKKLAVVEIRVHHTVGYMVNYDIWNSWIEIQRSRKRIPFELPFNPFKSNGSLRLFTSIVFCNQRKKRIACLKWRISGCNSTNVSIYIIEYKFNRSVLSKRMNFFARGREIYLVSRFYPHD